MSYDSLWCNDNQRAGPSYNSTPLSPRNSYQPYRLESSDISLPLVQSTSNSPHMCRKVFEDDYAAPQTKESHYRLRFSNDGGEFSEKMLQDPEYQGSHSSRGADAYNRLGSISSYFMGVDAPEASKIAEIQSPKIKTEEIEDWEMYLRGPSVGWANFDYQRDASSIVTPRNQSCSSLSSIETDDSLEVLRMVNPFFNERKLEPDNLPQRFTPYSPMPLPPVFSHECGSRIDHIPFDLTSPPSISSSLNIEDVKSLSINSSLTPTSPGTEDDSPSSPESTAIPEYLIPVNNTCLSMIIANSKTLESLGDDYGPDSELNIPLELAKHLAHQYRMNTSSRNARLPLQFLTSFMGQTYEGPHWKCYIQNCGKHLIRKSHMVDHIRMHLDERVYACEHCPQMFLRKADCKRHSAAHNPDKAFKCNSCTKAFGRKDLLTRHKRKCDPHDSTSPMIKDSHFRKRKGRKDDPIFNTEVLQSMFVPGKLFSLSPSENTEKNIGLEFQEPHDANKENIPPFLSTGGIFFDYAGESDDGRRKKARTRL